VTSASVLPADAVSEVQEMRRNADKRRVYRRLRLAHRLGILVPLLKVHRLLDPPR
jgi:hypothetical protein